MYSASHEIVPATALSWSLPQPVSTPWEAGTLTGTALPTIHSQPTPSAFQPGPEATIAPLLTPGLSLSPASEPFPAKLVERVRSGQFVEMRDLLTDNIALLQQLEVFGGQCPLQTLPGALKPRLRDVVSLPSWMYCFLAYVAIRSRDPATRDMLAYARLLIREAQRHGGSGWLDYDRVFRQQVAIDRTLRWNSLQSDIQAATLVGCAPGPRKFCTLCREPDHGAEQCALAFLQQPPVQASSSAGFGRFRPRPQEQMGRRPESRLGICVSWNKGRCIYPGSCRFRHICATCHQQHAARDCTATPSDSEYRRDPFNSGRRQPLIPSKPRPGQVPRQ